MLRCYFLQIIDKDNTSMNRLSCIKIGAIFYIMLFYFETNLFMFKHCEMDTLCDHHEIVNKITKFLLSPLTHIIR